jgi:hypothetical protein
MGVLATLLANSCTRGQPGPRWVRNVSHVIFGTLLYCGRGKRSAHSSEANTHLSCRENMRHTATDSTATHIRLFDSPQPNAHQTLTQHKNDTHPCVHHQPPTLLPTLPPTQPPVHHTPHRTFKYVRIPAAMDEPIEEIIGVVPSDDAGAGDKMPDLLSPRFTQGEVDEVSWRCWSYPYLCVGARVSIMLLLLACSAPTDMLSSPSFIAVEQAQRQRGGQNAHWHTLSACVRSIHSVAFGGCPLFGHDHLAVLNICMNICVSQQCVSHSFSQACSSHPMCVFVCVLLFCAGVGRLLSRRHL